MHVEITDIQSSRSYRIEGGDKILGREGASADIGIPDRAVSGKHARIFNSGGTWYLEDLGSSNGTFVQGSRISAPVELKAGMRFALCRYAYEVAQVVVPGGDATAVFDDPGYSDEVARTQVGAPPNFSGEHAQQDPAAQPTRPLSQRKTTASVESTASRAEQSPSPAPQAHVSTTPQGGAELHTDAASQADAAPYDDGMSQADAESFDNAGSSADGAPYADGDAKEGKASFGLDEPIVPYLLKNVPLAIAYYVAAVPVLLTNPLGTVRKSIAEPKFPVLGKMELAAYGAAAALASIVFGWIGGILAAVIGSITSGTFSFSLIISALIGPLVPGVITLAISVAVALFWHQIMDWVIPKLQGKNDHAGNSNFFVGTQTANLIGALAGAVSAIFQSIHLPFVGLPGPVVSLFGALITALVLYSWLKHFAVHKAIPIVVLVLMGVLPSLSTVGGLVSTISSDISGLGSGGDVDIADIEDVDIPDTDEDSAEAPDATDNADVAAALAAAQKANPAAAAAMANAQRQAAEAMAAKGLTDEQRAQIAAATKAAKAVAANTPKDAPAPAPAPKAEHEAIAAAPVEPQPKAPKAHPVSATPAIASPTESIPPAPKPKRSNSSYPTYKLHRDAIENAIKNDPTLLKLPGVMGLYKQLYRITAKVTQKRKIKLGRRPSPEQLADAKVAELVREADIYKATAQIVEKLYAKLF